MTFLVVKRAGQSFEEWDEDDYGNLIPLEEMSDPQLLKWKEFVESLGTSSQLAELMLVQIDEEIKRREAKERKAVGEK